jgi:hypothetical protein
MYVRERYALLPNGGQEGGIGESEGEGLKRKRLKRKGLKGLFFVIA